MKVYLASPLFTDKQKYRINNIVQFLRKEKKQEVFSPMELTIPDAWEISNKEWARKVYLHDVKELYNANVVVAIYDGMDSDTGTAWEIGYAAALGKDIIVLCPNIEDKQSLMIVNGATITMPLDEYQYAWDLYMDYHNGNSNWIEPYFPKELTDQS